jgi:segregation and condensation protein A
LRQPDDGRKVAHGEGESVTKELPFEDPQTAKADGEETFVIDVDGYEGPLDLLLELARRQKVDLSRISILALADQYLAFVESARRFRLELAADYLVMAAWLAYLKSRLLLPEPPRQDEPSAADLATQLALRLRRLEAIREAARQLGSRAQLGRDVFARGHRPEAPQGSDGAWNASLYDLLAAYARQRQRKVESRVTLHKRFVWSLVEAREALHKLVGMATDWTTLDAYLLEYAVDPSMRATVRASALSAMLEMVREGVMDIRQDRPFAPLYLRRRAASRMAAE